MTRRILTIAFIFYGRENGAPTLRRVFYGT